MSLDADMRIDLRSEMQISVTYKSDMYLRIGRRLETGRRSESYIYARLYYASLGVALYHCDKIDSFNVLTQSLGNVIFMLTVP